MSQENVELAQRAFAAFQRGEIEAFLACVDPDAEWRPLARELEGATHGHDGVRRWWTGLFSVFPDLRPSITDVRDLGDFVLIHMQGGGRGARSGTGIDLDIWQVVETRHGRIVGYTALRTEEEALEAVRRREGPDP